MEDLRLEVEALEGRVARAMAPGLRGYGGQRGNQGGNPGTPGSAGRSIS